MGYTHHWTREPELEPNRFARAAGECRAVCRAAGVPLKGIEGRPEPIFQEPIVAFDGGGEWFIVQCVCDENSPERVRGGKCRGFSKTEGLPYDLCVKACLIVFNEYFRDQFQVTSDGPPADWDSARELCQRTVGYGDAFRLADTPLEPPENVVPV